MQSQKVSKFDLSQLLSSQPDSPLPRYYTPNRMVLMKDSSKFQLNFVILEENSSDKNKNLPNKNQSFATCSVDNENSLSQDNILKFSPSINERFLLGGLEAGTKWNDAIKSSARRVKLLENGEEVEDCTWTEMKQRHIEWSEQKKNYFCESLEKDYGDRSAGFKRL